MSEEDGDAKSVHVSHENSEILSLQNISHSADWLALWLEWQMREFWDSSAVDTKTMLRWRNMMQKMESMH